MIEQTSPGPEENKEKKEVEAEAESSNEGEQGKHLEVHHNVDGNKRREPEDMPEKIILQEQDHSKQNILSQDVEFKLQEVLEDIQEDEGKNFQSIITLRMKELAYNKILVLTYGKSTFRLVVAHLHIGREYLRFNCYEQANKHFEISITQNKKATDNLTNKLYYSYQLGYLGETQYFMANYEEALKHLEKAVNIQTQLEQHNRKIINNFRTLKFLALVKAKLKHQEGLTQIKQASKKASKFLSTSDQSISHKEYGLLLFEEGKMQLQTNQDETIKKYNEAIEQIKKDNEPGSEEEAIKIYQELAALYETTNKEKYIETLKQKYQVFEYSYGNADKRSIKEQRNLVHALLKHKQIEEALEECQDILEKQKRVFGENSLEVGKEMKTLANIFLAKGDFKQVEHHLKKALKIFHDLGEQRLEREVKGKLTSLHLQQH